MNYKITEGFKKNKKFFIIGLVLWFTLIIVLVLPFTVAKYRANLFVQAGKGDFITNFIDIYRLSISSPISSIKYISKNALLGNLFSNFFVTTIVYLIFFIIGFSKILPKHQYDNIEHGSSDWSQGGEQYKILSNKEGIILAEKHFLPVNKSGNVKLSEVQVQVNLLHIQFLMHINYLGHMYLQIQKENYMTKQPDI